MPPSRPDLFDGVVPFVLTAEAKSFRKAARTLRLTTSAVSKAIARLEADVGVRLLHRSSRAVVLTSEGEAFFATCREAVANIEGARELLTAAQEAPRGVLRVSLPSTFGRQVVAALPELLARYPSLVVEVQLADRFVQLSDERVDVAVRVGEIDDSSCIRYPLRMLRLITAASPAYLAAHGVLLVPADLKRHNCLRFVLPNGLTPPWLFAEGGRVTTVEVDGSFRADHGEPLLAAATCGMGLVQAPEVMLSAEIARGELVEVLASYSAPGPPLSALCAPGRERSPKVRVMIELLRKLLADGELEPTSKGSGGGRPK